MTNSQRSGFKTFYLSRQHFFPHTLQFIFTISLSPKLHDFCVDIPITTSCDFLESRTELKWVVTANLKQQTYKQMNEWITKKAKTAAEN